MLRGGEGRGLSVLPHNLASLQCRNGSRVSASRAGRVQSFLSLADRDVDIQSRFCRNRFCKFKFLFRFRANRTPTETQLNSYIFNNRFTRETTRIIRRSAGGNRLTRVELENQCRHREKPWNEKYVPKASALRRQSDRQGCYKVPSRVPNRFSCRDNNNNNKNNFWCEKTHEQHHNNNNTNITTNHRLYAYDG